MKSIYSMLSDCHLHTSFSSDSETDASIMIETAIKLGLKNICITDHNDYDFPLEDGKIVFLLDFNKYVDSIAELKEKYSDKININIGVEQGLQPYLHDKINNYDPDKRLDFIIGSTHLVNGEDPYYPSFWENLSIKETIELYYEQTIESIKVCDNFDVYGHLDYIVRYIPKADGVPVYDYNWKNFYDYIEDILKRLIDKGKGIEINTAGLKYGMPECNPCNEILIRYRQLGGEILTTGSDAHKIEHLAYAYDKLPGILKKCGFDYYTIFKNRKPEFIKLDV